MIEWHSLLPVAHEAVDIGCRILRNRQAKVLTAKGDRDLVTEVDFEIERAVKLYLQQRTPSIGFLGEEEGRSGPDGGPRWALDPIDGTVNFVHGIPLVGISLGLIADGRSVLGVIDTPFLHRRYHAAEGHGAFNNDGPIHASEVALLAEAVVAVGDYAVGAEAAQRNTPRLAITQGLAGKAQRVRMHGAASIDLAWLAEGRIDAMVTMSNKPWDMAAGVIIAREAGVMMADADGTAHTPSSAATIGANPMLLPQVLALVDTAQQHKYP